MQRIKKIKKNDDEKANNYDKNDSFLSWGGQPQQTYEQFRWIALNEGDVPSGNKINLFKEWGMTLFMPEHQGPIRFWPVKRVRAPVRAGDFSLSELLFELGIFRCSSHLQKDLNAGEVCL